MAKLGMYSKPCKASCREIILRAHWQYHLKCTDDRRSCNCCDGSKRAAPVLHAVTSTYFSCVNQPVQRRIFTLAAINDHKVYCGDINAFVHSRSPDVQSYMRIDNVYSEWWTQRYDKDINRSYVLPVLCCLLGHPENGNYFERHINQILSVKELNFKATVYDCCINQTTYKEHKIFLLRQVDDILATHDESITKEIYGIIGTKLQLPGETDPPFTYLGLINNYNGVDINQQREYIEVTATNYIDRVITSHGWNDTVKRLTPDEPLALMPEDSVLRSLLILTIQWKVLLLTKISRIRWVSAIAVYLVS